MADVADESTPKRGFHRWRLPVGGVVAVVLLGLVGYWNRHPLGSKPLTGPDTPSDKPSVDANNPDNNPLPPPERLAILGGLKVGSFVAGWRIASITITSKPEVKGALTLLLRKDTKSFGLWILPKGQLKMPAPNETEGHQFFSGSFLETDWIEAGTPIEEIMAVVREAEASQAAPPPMSPTP